MLETTHQPETWKPVVGWEDRYEVSDLGRVRSIPGAKSRTHHVLCFNPKNDYLTVKLCRNDKRFDHYVHALVAAAFVGPRPAGLDVNHIDLNKHNNLATNLEYMTRRDNLRHAADRGHQHNVRNEKGRFARTTRGASDGNRAG